MSDRNRNECSYSEKPNSSNTISRQAAIDAVEKESRVDGAYGYMDTKSIVDLLNDLPSAQPERKNGSWNVIQGDIVICSECGMCAPKSMTGCLLNRHLEPNRTNFCPNCGAYMRGEMDAGNKNNGNEQNAGKL